MGVVYDEMTASVNCDVEEEACSSNEKRWTDSRTDLIRNTPACIILPWRNIKGKSYGRHEYATASDRFVLINYS